MLLFYQRGGDKPTPRKEHTMTRTFTITTQHNGKSFTFEGTREEAEVLAALIAINHGGYVTITD